ncbi:hypothetical protein [Mycobacterium sp.]|uniref:hypothetical protein n=1 Tax=Mycobacterium sp. TaxID=1785 RepID=UPI001274F395|nr:hypothetical protein [Mycobacterium sp.]KAA8969234.1 MAG: hypothetical protein F6Q13_03835 [Mycobacterium sp.]
MDSTVSKTGAADPVMRIVVVTLLAVDGILSAVVGALLLPAYIGSVPFPVSALISGLLNAALVWAAGAWTKSARVAALPLWTWLVTIAVMSLGGPGDDCILAMTCGGPGYRAILLLALGVGLPVWVLWRRRSPHSGEETEQGSDVG